MNSFLRVNVLDRDHLNNISHCYDKYTGEPSFFSYNPPLETLHLRLDQFFNRKKQIIVNFIDYFKHLPEFRDLPIDDQVSLIKHNIRLILPLNYAILKSPSSSRFARTQIQTVGCPNNANLHQMFCKLSNAFVQFVMFDPLIVKLLIVILFFNSKPTTTVSLREFSQYEKFQAIKSIQTTYTELLWLYLVDKCGEKQAVLIYSKMVTQYLHIQIIIEKIDAIIRTNETVRYLDELLKTILQLTWNLSLSRHC